MNRVRPLVPAELLESGADPWVQDPAAARTTEGAHRRARPVGRRLEDRQGLRELRQPPTLVTRSLGAAGRQPGHVLAELHRRRQRGAASGALRFVDRQDVAGQEDDG